MTANPDALSSRRSRASSSVQPGLSRVRARQTRGASAAAAQAMAIRATAPTTPIIGTVPLGHPRTPRYAPPNPQRCIALSRWRLLGDDVAGQIGVGALGCGDEIGLGGALGGGT